MSTLSQEVREDIDREEQKAEGNTRKHKSSVSALRAAKRISKGLTRYHTHNTGKERQDVPQKD